VEDGIRDRNVTGVQTCALPILFKACKVNALSQIPKVDQDDLRYARHEFEQYSLEDKIHFIENVYDYQLVNPTPQNVREWEKFHGEKWTYDIKEKEFNEV